MLRQSLKFIKYTSLIIVIALVLSSCSSSDDLPKGAKYLEPIWFDNLTEYATGNHNTISGFKDGLAVAKFANMGEYWSVSDEKSAIIDKSGEILWGPIEGKYYINIIDNKHFYIQDTDNHTSKIMDIDNNTVGIFDGILTDSERYSGELFNTDNISVCYNNQGYGLAKMNGQIIVSYKYKDAISSVHDEHIVFLKNEDRNSADIYNSDGSFSHSMSLGYDLSSKNYQISEYKNGLFKIGDLYDGYYNYGLADIYGNVILQPNYDSVEIISKDCIVVSKSDNKGCQLLNKYGEIIKNFDFNCYNITEMVNDVFMLSDGYNTHLVTSKGDILKEYAEFRYPKYCGDGIFSIASWSYPANIQLVDSETGDYIGEQYRDRHDIIFNEGYAFAEDLEYNSFVIDKKGNKYCEGYEISNSVTDRVVKINGDVAGIICLPPIE